jgi:hypothetical protein
MTVCQGCGRPREGSEFRCPDCGCEGWCAPTPTGQAEGRVDTPQELENDEEQALERGAERLTTELRVWGEALVAIVGAAVVGAAGFYVAASLPVWLERPGGPSEPAMLVGGLLYGPVGGLLGMLAGAFVCIRLLKRSKSRGRE